MKTQRALISACAAILMGLAASAQAAGEWLTDYEKAQQEAKANHKLLLMNFTGSDWCGYCILLDRYVFSRPEFKEYANKNLVLLEIDFPRPGGSRWNAQSDAVRKQNEQLAMKYQILGYPTIVVLNGEGKIVGELGYTDTPQSFIDQLEKLRKS